MADKIIKENDKDIDIFSFERKLVELVEELRFRRQDLEVENEKTMKSVLDEKYKSDIKWDELHRKHIREKDELEQQISFLKRRLEDKVCVSDDEKVKQHMISKTYSQEIRTLKEELRAAKSENLTLVKKVQELEGKLKLHNNFQESISSQLIEIRKNIKTLTEQCRDLANEQQKLLTIVADAKMAFKKYDLCNQNIQQSLVMSEKKNIRMTKELLECRTELTMLKNSKTPSVKITNNYTNIEKIQQRNLELENLFLMSRKENEKCLQNFINCQKELCKFMKKYADAEEKSHKVVEEAEKQLDESKKQVKLLEQNLHDLEKSLEDEKKKNRKEAYSVQTQTSEYSHLFESTNSKNAMLPSSDCSLDYENKSLKFLGTSSKIFTTGFDSDIMFEIMKKQVTNRHDSVTTLELQNKTLILKGKFDNMDYQGFNVPVIDKCLQNSNKNVCYDSAIKASAVEQVAVPVNTLMSKNILIPDSVKRKIELTTEMSQAFHDQDLAIKERPFKLLKMDTSIEGISSSNPRVDSVIKSVATKIAETIVEVDNIVPGISLKALNSVNSEKKNVDKIERENEMADEYGSMQSDGKPCVENNKVDAGADLKVYQNDREKESSSNVVDGKPPEEEEIDVLWKNIVDDKESKENEKCSVDASLSCDTSTNDIKSSMPSSLKEFTKSAMKYMPFLSGNI